MHTYLQAIGTVTCPPVEQRADKQRDNHAIDGAINLLLSSKPINRYQDISKNALFLDNIEFAID